MKATKALSPMQKGLSLLGYHLCNQSVIRHVNKMVAYQRSYEKQIPCGGWIPWSVCTKTYYKEEYHPVMVPETVNITDCCNGYEQVGLYCTLPLNRSREFASRLGACPAKEVEVSDISCALDIDCPEHKKCCETTKGMGCADPVPEEQRVTKYWYNVSVLVKMDFHELSRLDPRLLNHSRLLHSMITGALWSLNVSVYHIKTTQAKTYAETVASQVMIGLEQLVSLANLTSLLKDIVMRVYEVIDIVVQDNAINLKTDKSFIIAIIDPPAIRNLRTINVTSSSFEMSWSVDSMQNHSFHIEVYKGKELIQATETTDMQVDVSSLEAGVMYTVKVSYEACDRNISSYRNVKTDAWLFALTIRILNYNLTDQLLYMNSTEYQAFSSILMTEIRQSLPASMAALHRMGKLGVQVVSLKAGSVIVRLKIIVDDPEFPRDVSAFDPMMSMLYKSVALVVDSNSSAVEDWDECASEAENDCCTLAECTNMIGSYMCQCKASMDTNPLRPGRNCEESDPGSRNVLLKNGNSSVLVTNSTSVSRKVGRSLECDPPVIRNLRTINVTSSSFEMSWSVDSMQNHSFHIEVYKGKELIQATETTDMQVDVSSLEAGVMYTVKVSYEACDRNISSYRNVKTDAWLFALTIRILNYNLTDQLLYTNSTEYQAFSSILMTEIRQSLPASMAALHRMGKLGVQVVSLKAGSVIVRLKIIVDDPEFPRDVSAFDPMMSMLYKSVALVVDSNSSAVEDWDECASEAENDCCTLAQCTNTIGSYICRCKTTTDANPLRPGRNCEGEIVDPVTDMVPTPEANVTEAQPVTGAPSLSMAGISAVTSSASRSTQSTTLPSSDTQQLSPIQTNKTLSASQKTTASGHVWNNNTLRIAETTALVTEAWDNVNISSGDIPDRRSRAHIEHNSSLPKVSNITDYPFLRNGSVEETSTPALLIDRSSQLDPSLNVTQYSKRHMLNQTLDEEVKKDNRSSAEEKSSTLLPGFFDEQNNISFAEDCGGLTVISFVLVTFPAERIVFSNVTSTSFQVGWTANFTQNPAFHFLLLEGKRIIQEIKTQNNSLTISRLEPGILYTVEIKTEVCGNKSELVQRKVKTAAQKFNGTVRISNMNYCSELSNSSSEKYQNFSQLFLMEVRTSLPAHILEKMNTHMIKMSIMSITNGSIVVSFSLLIPANMDASNVSRCFLDALRHSRRFRIDNSSLSIHDYDECESEETDCSSNAYCNNRYGYYECICKEGFVNVNAERPGRNCEGKVSIFISFHSNSELTLMELLGHFHDRWDSSAVYREQIAAVFISLTKLALLSNPDAGGTQTKNWSSTVLPLTYPYTSNHTLAPARENSSAAIARSWENATMSPTVYNVSTEPIVNNHSSTHTLPLSFINPFQGMFFKKAVQVLCEFEKIVITIPKDFLRKGSIPESSLYLGSPECNTKTSNSSHVILQTGWHECATEVQSNTTHTIVKTILRNDMPYVDPGIIHFLKIASPIDCVFENELLTSSGYITEGFYTMSEDLHGSGHFLTKMKLFIGRTPIHQNFTISASDDIRIEVGIHTRDKKLKVFVSECWATPTNNSKDPLSFPFILGSCPVPNTYTTMIANGLSNKVLFKLKIFSFVNNSVAYLHCKIRVCMQNPGTICRKNCDGYRSQRTGQIISAPGTTWGPLRRFVDDVKEEKKPGLGVGYIVLIVIGVFVFVLGIVGLLVCRRRRKSRSYNFKIKSDNFNYQLFL
ncbi:Uromodulin-like 1 [Varanus komodoensis]|nr:Uromodulin-like 1 [Varanus komodoensis]